MDVAALHNHSRATVVYLYRSVEVDNLAVYGRLAFEVELHVSDSSPVADFAIPDTDAVAVLYDDGPLVNVRTFHNHIVQQNIACSLDEESRRVAAVLKNGTRGHSIAYPAGRAALFADLQRETETVRVQDNGPGYGNGAFPGAEAGEAALRIAHNSAALIGGILFQGKDTASVAGLGFVIGERVHLRPPYVSELPVFQTQTVNGIRGLQLNAAGVECRTWRDDVST